MALNEYGLSPLQALQKRTFDLVLSFAGLCFTWWIVAVAYLLSAWDTGNSGFFIQSRVGKDGALIDVIKIRTMRPMSGIETTVTGANDPRITKLGAFFRKTKIDELPQLWNVLRGDMSFVGPRPDVPGYADLLSGNDRRVLLIRPGITGPATLKYRDEETILANQREPEKYNAEVIFPDKVNLNLQYIEAWSLIGDVRYILQTVIH